MSSLVKPFHIYKWYADIIDKDTGDLTIFYLGEIEWKLIKFSFTNILQYLERRELVSIEYFKNYIAPLFNENVFHIETSDLSGKWVSKSEPICEKLFENQYGYILWECFIPFGLGEIKVGGKLAHGFGYVEKLTLTLKPWQIPIKILRWGRFVTEKHQLVWIRWEGDCEKFLIIHNGKRYSEGIINDDKVQYGNYCLTLSTKNVIRHGSIIDTALNKILWIKTIFPSEFLSTIECKWQSWSEFYENNSPIGNGWAVHEYVDFKPPKFDAVGKFFYGLTFVFILPLLLIFWSQRTEKYIFYSTPTNFLLSTVLIILGLVLTTFPMIDLWVQGGGLPMNAYPPSNLVTTGSYKYFSHPIYLGSSFLSYGMSMYFRSKSGFWLISPILTLSWMALVYGYENDDLKRRFPKMNWRPIFSIPENSLKRSTFYEKIISYCLVYIPWFILYEMVLFVGIPTNSKSTYFEFEKFIPVIEWTELFYLAAYPYVLFIPIILTTKEQIRSFTISGLMNTFIGIYLQFILPFICQPKPFIPETILGRILYHEREYDGPTGAFPSFHVSWAFLSAYYYTWAYERLKHLFYILSLFISISCVTTGMHSIIDVIGGFILFLICIRREILWIFIRNYFENLANSWKAYRIGKLRIINHSLYAFLSTSTNIFILFSLIGHVYSVLSISFLSIISSAIWGQIIENSPGFSRPFGYFGCIIGGSIGSILASWYFNIELIKFLSAYALVSPWVLVIGRLRCIVQGCCHGRPTDKYFGILVTNPRSRVCSLSKIKNVYIHVAPGYSMISNLIIGILLWRLWYSNVSPCLIVSLYFILIGLSRFVEESYRGEIQTPIYFKLKIYQWMSILFVLIGIILSIILSDENIQLNLAVKYEYILPSLLFGLSAAFVMSMDFPESNKRFSKLSD